ncbi:MAG: SurA N-terminal domain-containing protein [Acidobacteria bacterium]|nr:SurA N-terminal domain-containing protein [Acidobacteriota bacterium]
MLKQFSRMEKTRSLLILFFVVILLLGLVVAGVLNRTSGAITNPMRSRDVIAKVNGDPVTVADLNLRKKAYEQQMGGQFSLAQLGLTDERLLDSLINDRIAVQQAARLNLAPSDEEVRDLIRKQFSDASGNFDLKRYKEVINRNYGSVEVYEQGVRDDIAKQKLRAFITAGAQVSDLEVQKDWERKNTTLDLTYVPVTANDLAKSINPSDEELQKYYAEHQTDFRVLEPQKKFQYLFISQDKVGEKINIPDEDLRREYDQLKPENKEAGVKVQQIVLKVARPELDQTVLGKATDLVARVRGQDLKASEEAFAELARGNSEDPATAKQGGFLPAPVKKNPNKSKAARAGDSTALAQNVFDLQPGQVSDPLKTGNAYYLFRRGDSVPKTFEDAKNELVVSSRNRRSYAAAAQLAARAAESLKGGKDFQTVAKELAPEANMKPEEMIKTTPFVKPGDNVPDIGSSPQFEQAVEPLNDPGQIGDRVSVKGGFAIPSLVAKKEPNVIPEFAEIKDKVTEALRTDRAKSQLEQTARDIAANTGSADALKSAAEKHGLKAETAEAYKLGTPLGSVGTDPAADSAIFGLKAGEVTKTPIKISDSWVVIGATKRTDADLAKFGEQRDKLVESALTERRSEVYEEYIASVRKRLDQNGDIQIYKDVMEKLADAEQPPAAAPPRAPRRPPTGVPAQGK